MNPPGSILALVVLLALAPARASADEGERWLALSAVGELPAAGGLDAMLQAGLTDALAARFVLGGRAGTDGFAGQATAGLSWAWDVLAWVPSAGVVAGARVGEGHGVVGLAGVELGLTRFSSLETAVHAGVMGGWRTSGEAFVALTLGLWWRG